MRSKRRWVGPQVLLGPSTPSSLGGVEQHALGVEIRLIDFWVVVGFEHGEGFVVVHALGAGGHGPAALLVGGVDEEWLVAGHGGNGPVTRFQS